MEQQSIKQKYEISIKVLRNLKEKPTKKQWNKLAIEKNLLTAESIQYLSNCSIQQIWNRIHNAV